MEKEEGIVNNVYEGKSGAEGQTAATSDCEEWEEKRSNRRTRQ